MGRLLKGCAEYGGCISDYIAVAFSACAVIFVAFGASVIFRKRHVPEIKAKQVSLMVLQSGASIVFITSLLVRSTGNKLHLEQQELIQNAVRNVDGAHPYLREDIIGISTDIEKRIQTVKEVGWDLAVMSALAKRRLPPLKSFQLVPLLLLPWIAAAAVVEGVGPFEDSDRCVPHSFWWLMLVFVHLSYSLLLVFGTWKIRNIRFEFNEFRELIAGGSLCVIFIVIAFLLNLWNVVKKNESEALEVATRFTLVIVGDLVVIFFFWFPVSRPFMAQFGVRLRENDDTMGQALGVPPSGLLVPPTRTAMNFDEPLDILLQNKRFRLSFLAFADSRLAGEAVHFYDEVRVLNRMPLSNFVVRIYMATYIIDKYIQVGSRMEINISHQMRSEILNTLDLTNPNLFKRAISEAINMMQTNLEKDYWTSSYFRQLKEELDAEAEYSEQLERMSIRNFPLRRLSYDPLPNYDNPFETGETGAGEEEGIWMPIDDFSDCGKYDTDGNLVQPAMYLNDPESKSTYSLDSSTDGAQVADLHLETSEYPLAIESMRNPEVAEFGADVKSQQGDELGKAYHE